jgi:hypothetical protein
VGESEVTPEIVDVNVKSNGLVTHSLILNSFNGAISSAYYIRRLIAGLLNKYLSQQARPGNEKSEWGK